MANIIISNSIISVSSSNITARSQDPKYPRINVLDNWHLVRHYRSTDATASTWLLKIDFGSTQQLTGIFLNDVNFEKVRIEGSDDDTSWGAPSYASTHTISKDERVDRYKIFISATDFNYRYMRIFIPTGTTVASTHTVWKVGTVVCLSSHLIFNENMAYGYQRSANRTYEDISLPHGGVERVSLGDYLAWSGQAVFNVVASSNESDLWTLNAMNISNPIVFYENAGETDKAYLCLRDSAYTGTVITNDLVKCSVIRFKEIV
jgi:hypothetical protein